MFKVTPLGCQLQLFSYVVPFPLFFTILKILYLIREREKEGEREGEKHRSGCFSPAPNRGPGWKPTLVPLQKMEPA